MKNISEQELIEQCAAGDRSGQKCLFDKYYKAMFNVSFRIINDHDESLDAVQEGFIQVFNDLSSFRGDSTLGAWIKMIIVRCSLRKLNKATKHVSLDVKLHDQPVEWNDSFNAQELDDAIRSLPNGYRAIFLLIEKEGYKHKEVAEMLEISEGTSKSQLFQAKKLLQTKLRRY